MKLASSLALKWLGGIAALGGAGGGAFILHKSGYLSGGGKGVQNKEAPKDQNLQIDLNTIATEDKVIGNSTNGDHRDKVAEDEGLGFPEDCETNGYCTLDEEKIKKIKFKDLEEIEGKVTVTGLRNGQTFTPLIQGEEGKKKYIFDNASGPTITISKGNAKVNIPEGKKIKFINENNKLKKLEEGKYGLPEDCQENTTCFLTQNDLEDIKFSNYTELDEHIATNVTGLDNKKSVSLTIEGGKYIFNSPSSVNIAKNTTTIILNQGDTEFKVDQEKLKKLEFWSFGLPEDCKVEESTETKNCTLSLRDLKKIKFKDMGTNISISGLNGDEKVSLDIKKANDSSFPDGRKYIFTPQGSSDVTITESSKTITLSKTKENTFKKEREGVALVEVPKRTTPTSDVIALDSKISGLGLPDFCSFTNKASGENKSIECELSHDELKALKFSVGSISSASGGQEEEGDYSLGDPKTYKLKIEEDKDTHLGSQNIRITFLNKGVDRWSKKLIIGGTDSNALIIANQSNTEFKINDKKELEMAWDEKSLSDQVGLKCPKGTNEGESKCSLKDNGETISVLIGEEEKEFKPSNKDEIETNMEYETNADGFNQGIKIEVKTKIIGTNKDKESETLELETTNYEIKRISEQNWRFTKMIMVQ